MQTQNTNYRQSRVLSIGFLLMLGVVVWYGGRFWYQHRDTGDTISEETVPDEGVSLTDLRFLTPKEVLARMERNEAILFIDIRTREDFDVEHIVDSTSVPVTTLNTFSPPNGKLIIVVSGPDIPNATLKGIHNLFAERKYTFAFLEGSIAEWKVAGGTTVSTGDPDSLFDYSKVIFIDPSEVSAKATDVVNPFFLDIRNESFFQKEHIPGAINIPLAQLEERRGEIPRGQSIFVYGTNDYESYQGGVRLFDLNFFGSRVIRGGFTAWKEKQLPVTTETK